jgi:hypothetical protein
MNEREIMDIECYSNFFCSGLKNFDTKKITFYEISEEKNELDLIYNLFINYKGFLITFNGIHYDNMIIKYIIINYNRLKNLNWLEVCKELKKFSDKIIYTEDYDNEIKRIKYYKTGWTDIDLFLYWSKMLRISKKISLKSLGIQLGYPVTQELPYKHDTILKISDLPKLRYYNYTHDLGITELLLEKMQEDVILRANIVKDYGINCWSWDAPKIASEALLQDYCRITWEEPFDSIRHKFLASKMNEVRKRRFNKPELDLRKCLEGFDPEFKLDIFKNLWEEILNSKNSFSKDLIVNEKNTSIKLSYGIGGLHSVNENEQYYTDTDYQVVTSDVASLYPNLIIIYNCIRYNEVLNRYLEVKTERLIAKKNKDKAKDTFLKLILNSTSGLIDNQHSWLYFPEGAMRLRLIGQLILTKCIEACILNNWQVVSANTDGIEAIVPKEELENYEKVLNEVCGSFKLDLEHEYYDKIIYKNVNNYIAVTNAGKFKQKGLFVPEPILGNSVDELVIAKALEAYYTKDIQPREFISNPDKYSLHIYDYCKSNKIGKDFIVLWNGQIQQQLNRYYFSKKGNYLYKQKNGQGTMQHVNVGQPIILFNNYKDKPFEEYNIDYSHYISATQKIIDELNRYDQLTLF